MNESFSSRFIRYPIGTSLLMAGILFVGMVAYPLLPVAPLPQVDFPTIQISASLPGASPKPWRPPSRSRWSGNSRRFRALPR
ncbi:multidrug efflux pump subunit AcrB [Bradyrhizobium sp. USDA 4516]